MRFIKKSAKLAPVRTNILEILEIFVHHAIADHALFKTLALSTMTNDTGNDQLNF